jgi:tRNA(adenine34) deaminase
MQSLIAIAKTAAQLGEVPIAASIVGADGIAIATYHNEVEARRDATAHAEILAIQMACRKLGRKSLEDYTLYVTLEPCAMCAAAARMTQKAAASSTAHGFSPTPPATTRPR